MSHLDRFTKGQRDALDLLRTAIRRYAMADFAEIPARNPHALSRGLLEARSIVASDPDLMREAGRQMFTQFDLAPYDKGKRDATLAAYHDEAQLSQWTVIALDWVGRLAMAMAAREPPTQH